MRDERGKREWAGERERGKREGKERERGKRESARVGEKSVSAGRRRFLYTHADLIDELALGLLPAVDVRF